MSGPEQLAAQIKLTADWARPSPAIRRGVVVSISAAPDVGSAEGPWATVHRVTVNVAGRDMEFDDDNLGAQFRAELAAHAADFTPLLGRKVEVHFSAGQVPVIAYTVGV